MHVNLKLKRPHSGKVTCRKAILHDVELREREKTEKGMIYHYGCPYCERVTKIVRIR